jgi:hypothetical protein
MPAILHDVLRGQANGDSGHAGGGQQGSEIDPQGSQKLQSRDQPDDGQARGADDPGQGFDLGNPRRAGRMLLGQVDHAKRDDAQ